MLRWILLVSLIELTPALLLGQIITSTSVGGQWDFASTWIGGIVPDSSNATHVIIDGPVSVIASVEHPEIPVSFAGILTINDSLILYAGFSLSGSLVISASGNLLVRQGTINIDGPATISSPGSFIATVISSVIFSGNISASGLIDIEGPTTFDGSTVFTGAGTKTFYDVTINGTLTPNAVYTIKGDLTISTSGLLKPGANTVMFSGPDTHISNSGSNVAAFNDVIITQGSKMTSNVPILTIGSFVIAGEYISNGGFTANNDVSISVGTGAVTINNVPISVAGTLTVSNGSMMTVNEGADVTLLGNLSISGSLIIFAITHIPNETIITGSGNKIFNSMIITGRLTPNAAITINGDFILNDNGVLIEGTSTTTFGGPNAFFSNNGNGDATFHNILVTADNQLTNLSPFKSNGNFRTSGNFIANSDFSCQGTLTISRGGKFVSTNSDVNVGGNFAISGSYDANGTTLFSGNTKITGAGTKKFHDIIINGSLTSYTGIINVSGGIVNNGNFFHNSGTISFGGDSEKTVSSDLVPSSPLNLYNIVLNGGAAENDLLFNVDINLGGVLTINTTTAPASLDVDGVLDNKIFTLLSTNDNPATDASIAALPDDATIDGQLTVQRYLSGEGRIYRYLCTALQGGGATVATWQQSFPITGSFADPSNPGIVCGVQVQQNNPSLYYYDEPTKDYVPYPTLGNAAQNELTTGVGYTAFIRRCLDSTIISVSGRLENGVNRGTVLLPVTHTEPVTTYNNLVGNPFPSAINWDKVSLTNISPTIAIRDNATGIFQYYTQNGTGALDIPNGAIAQGQAFWVRSTGANPIISVNENSKTTSSASTGNIFYRTVSNLLEIDIAGIHQKDKAFILINSDARSDQSLDKFDAPKMINQRDDPYEELLNIGTQINNGPDLAINAVPSVECGTLFNLSISGLSEGIYNLRFKRSGDFSKMSVSAFDNFTNVTIQADSAGNYKFSVTTDTASHSRNRFKLTLTTPHDDAHIILVDPATLKSNFANGNRWNFEDELLPDTTATLKIERSGLYKLNVSIGKCKLEDEKAIIYTEIEDVLSEIKVYPNPIRNILNIEIQNPKDVPEKIEMMDMLGRGIAMIDIELFEFNAKIQIDLSGIAAGIYFLLMRQHSTTMALKVMKY